jgi:hypothetical protein
VAFGDVSAATVSAVEVPDAFSNSLSYRIAAAAVAATAYTMTHVSAKGTGV